MVPPVITRFAPSPTGALHLGNVRTALFNWLYARRQGGRFLLRIEDTDRVRSSEESLAGLLGSLRWLGLDWDAGPGCEDDRGPYRQSARGALYEASWARLEAAGLAYPCYCRDDELEFARKAALAAGRPPRYPGTCAQLDAAGRAARLAEGRRPALRFRVPDGTVEYLDLVRGPQRFEGADLGDFVIRRADGDGAFLFTNAVDDAAMGVTHALRGEDHVANTPRQLLLIAALGAAPPAYGHLPLLVGAAGVPLSKRDRAGSVAALAADGILPDALLNLLGRLGHRYAHDGWLDRAGLIAGFDLGALGRAPAHVDPTQLRHWQKEAVAHADAGVLASWVRGVVPPGREAAFIAALRANIVLPEDAREWAPVVYGELPCATGELATLLAGAGPAFYAAALEGARAGDHYPALVARIRGATGKGGAALFKPLRGALTGRLDGPELAQLLAVMPPATMVSRLEAAARLATPAP